VEPAVLLLNKQRSNSTFASPVTHTTALLLLLCTPSTKQLVKTALLHTVKRQPATGAPQEALVPVQDACALDEAATLTTLPVHATFQPLVSEPTSSMLHLLLIASGAE
jgi:hypothetical protein